MAELKMLAIDLGASSGRGIVGSFDGERLTLRENHRFPNEPVMAAGAFCWDILRIFHEIKNAIRKCALSDDPGERNIRSIGIDTWGVDYGYLDKNGVLLANPYNYRDKRTEIVLEDVFAKVPLADIYSVTGIQSLNINSLYQIMADLRDRPELVAAAEKLLFVPDLLNYFLTGVSRTEYTIASTGMILDAEKRTYARDMLEKLGIPSKLFGELVQPGSVIGPLLPQVQEEVGEIHANVVNIAAHDTASAVIAVPATSDDFVFISSGTWSLMGTELKSPVITPLSQKYDFTNEGGAQGTIRFLKNIMGLWIEQESKRQWEREGVKVTYDQLSVEASASTPFACFINPDDDAFSPPGNMPKRISEYCRRTGQKVPETRGEIVRCIFESLAFKYRYTVEKMEEITGKQYPFIHIVGGGTKEEMLSQFTANATGKPVYAGPVEATAIGNLMMQAIAAGEVADLAQAREIVRNSFPVKHYTPADTAAWDEAYARFKALIG